jgi:hypothetical protein
LKLAIVDDSACAIAFEGALTFHEVFVIDVHRCGNNRSSVYLRAFTKDHAVGIGDDDLAIGFDHAIYL